MPGKQKEIEFLGIPEIRKQFESLTGSLQRRVLRQAVNAGATALSSAIRKATPRDTGTLKKSVKRKPSSKWRSGKAAASKGIIGATVGYDIQKAPHWNLIAYGHKAVYWGHETGERVPGQTYFQKAAKNAGPAIRAKITAKAKQALPKAIVKQMTK